MLHVDFKLICFFFFPFANLDMHALQNLFSKYDIHAQRFFIYLVSLYTPMGKDIYLVSLPMGFSNGLIQRY